MEENKVLTIYFFFHLIIGCLKGIVATTRKSNDPLTWLIGSNNLKVRGHSLNGLLFFFYFIFFADLNENLFEF